MDAQEILNGSAGAFIRAVTSFVFVEDAPEAADVILVPGSRHPGHTLRAAELYRAGCAPFVLPSGRYPLPDGRFAGVLPEYAAEYGTAYETEWAFMRAVLLRHGVPDSAILREDTATYTWENAQRSRQVLDSLGLPYRRAILCCRAFHARRALLYYQAAFPETRFTVCPTAEAGLSATDWFLSPEGRARVLGEVNRLGGQVCQVFEDMLPRA